MALNFEPLPVTKHAPLHLKHTPHKFKTSTMIGIRQRILF
uniref:Uncharacterized protein n=1 Tax=Rhizophora mucronata TaxID=61149 RepID=A0A2P2P7H8_RHIMU